MDLTSGLECTFTLAVTEAVGNIVEKWEMTYRALEHLIDDTRPSVQSAHSEEAQENQPAPTDDKVHADGQRDHSKVV